MNMNIKDYTSYRPEQLFLSGTEKYNVRTNTDSRGSNSIQLPKLQERPETTSRRKETRRP